MGRTEHRRVSINPKEGVIGRLGVIANRPVLVDGDTPTLEEADPASFDPVARLKRLDESGGHAQVLYPNLIAFFSSPNTSPNPHWAPILDAMACAAAATSLTP